MKGALLIMLLIAMLIVGTLLIKNMGSHSSNPEQKASKIETVKKAEDIAEKAKSHLDLHKKAQENAE